MKRSTVRPSAVVPGFLAALAAIVFPSCDLFNYADPIDPLLYTENLIANIGFDQNICADETVSRSDADSTDVTGKWDFAYCYENWDDYFGYMTLNAVTASGYATAGDLASTLTETLPTGLATTAPVYQVELVNLVKDGDFESGITGTWTVVAKSPTYVWDSTNNVNGTYSVRIDGITGTELRFEPTYVSGYSFIANQKYVMLFRYKDGGSVEPTINGTLFTLTERPYDNFNYYKDDYVSSSGAAPTLLFGTSSSGSISTFDIDDVMTTRSGGMRLYLRLYPSATTPNLVPGRYQFSVWVHADPDASVTASPYQMDTFDVTIRNASNGYNATSSTVTYAQGTSGWQQLVVTHPVYVLQFIDSKSSGYEMLPVIDLVLDFNNSLPGRILLAAPDFRMIQ